MLGGLNPKKMQALMKQMGMDQQEIDASRVIIEKNDNSKIVIENPSIVKIKMQGQESFQISGDIKEEQGEKFSADDINSIMEKTGAPEEKVREALEKTGDFADAILELSQ